MSEDTVVRLKPKLEVVETEGDNLSALDHNDPDTRERLKRGLPVHPVDDSSGKKHPCHDD